MNIRKKENFFVWFSAIITVVITIYYVFNWEYTSTYSDQNHMKNLGLLVISIYVWSFAAWVLAIPRVLKVAII